ncbi:uncharacterized protein TRIADDRAFT_50000 [Trichoplax adhaerens]|uniref:guanylate kinase n=1 Tax=Trichoplax adhaerens TaxID=10228 RepID=B3RRU9_TRIAD|nr:hypothetical protein TRIADDRAFT_50000 [Trichoplax adhaerens]EDV26412.1 hypothetical protein TRIADDRAFT_50000 [Trichoplax adhaerens]|eukprot:XP_002110408.1 hypothetical protein TRIADDRAFT_50000 [Trichoplax adhaerens]
MALRSIAFCGPSGSGKSTLIKMLLKDYPYYFGLSISHTTRKPRQGEQNGREYYFTQRDEMTRRIKNGEFIESAEYSGNLYGTSKKAVQDVTNSGKVCLLDIDVQGIKILKKTDLPVTYIFIKSPNQAELEKRLRNRATETEESLQKRLKTAIIEMEFGESPGVFDHIIINDHLPDAYSNLKAAITTVL